MQNYKIVTAHVTIQNNDKNVSKSPLRAPLEAPLRGLHCSPSSAGAHWACGWGDCDKKWAFWGFSCAGLTFTEICYTFVAYLG